MEIKDLESLIRTRKAEYKAAKHKEWEWQDEGLPYAIQEYLSHCGEFTDADREYINRDQNLKELVAWIEDDPDEPAEDSQQCQTEQDPIKTK